MRDLHVHTVFSDGKNTPEEMILKAIELGMEEIGFSDHSHSPQNDGEEWSMPRGREKEYRAEIARLKEKYKGRIRVLCGTEQDLYSDVPPEGYDYFIGSLHYVRVPGTDSYVSVDLDRKMLKKEVAEYFGGDFYAFTAEYYRQFSRLPQLYPACSVIGHFDLVTKFIEEEPLFDTSDPRYIAAWQQAADALLKMNIPFEINTGAMARGRRTSPYPAREIRDYIRARGGKMILSSDSHRTDTLGHRFEDWRDEAEDCPVG